MTREVDLGRLSVGESEFRPEAKLRGDVHAEPRPTFPRRNYAEALAVAERARDELVAQLQAGVPAVHKAMDPSVYAAQASVYRLVEAFAWASIALYKAAQLVCDSESILDEDAAEFGIRFEIGL